jgi:hypothetical protein
LRIADARVISASRRSRRIASDSCAATFAFSSERRGLGLGEIRS